MLTDLEAAKLCQSLYNSEKIFDYVNSIGQVDFALKGYADCTAIIFEGSHTPQDWANDFDAHMICPPGLNGAGVHQGFYNGLSSVLVQLEPMITKTMPIVCIGHSLGAGRAHIFAAMLTVLGYNVQVIAFGSPRPGDKNLAAILEPIPSRSYWNYKDEWNHDIVGDVPVAITPLFLFVVPRERIKVNIMPDENDPWGHIMGWHHLNYYIKGLENG